MSRTLREPLPWRNSTLLSGDAADTVARLKERSDEELTVLGSGELVRTLMQHDLADTYLLSIHPLVLGPTTTGVIMATYRRAEVA